MMNTPPYDWYKQITPKRFVIHTTHKKHRKSILRDGLVPSIGYSYKANWSEDEFGKILPAVFAKDVDLLEEAYQSEYNDPNHDYWLIDTQDTSWYEDDNIGYPCIMCFEPLKKVELINIKKI